jgi:hypothetical protein
MHSEAQQPFIKHICLVVHENNYRNNTNFTKQHKSIPNTGWLLVLWGTWGFSYLARETYLGSPETASFIY